MGRAKMGAKVAAGFWIARRMFDEWGKWREESDFGWSERQEVSLILFESAQLSCLCEPCTIWHFRSLILKYVYISYRHMHSTAQPDLLECYIISRIENVMLNHNYTKINHNLRHNAMLFILKPKTSLSSVQALLSTISEHWKYCLFLSFQT